MSTIEEKFSRMVKYKMDELGLKPSDIFEKIKKRDGEPISKTYCYKLLAGLDPIPLSYVGQFSEVLDLRCYFICGELRELPEVDMDELKYLEELQRVKRKHEKLRIKKNTQQHKKSSKGT